MESNKEEKKKVKNDQINNTITHINHQLMNIINAPHKLKHQLENTKQSTKCNVRN